MKRVLSVLLFLLCCLTFSQPLAVGAENPDYPRVIDVPGVLSYEEWEELEEAFWDLQEQFDCDVAAIIDEELYSYDIESSADDVYDDLEYGCGSDDDGILLYISTDTREYHFTTHGYGITAFTEDGIEYLKREVEPYLQDNNYYGAIKAYGETADELLAMARNGSPYQETDWTYIAIVIGCAIGIPLLIAFVLMSMQLAKMNTAVSNDFAKNYVKPGSYHLDMARDIFLYSRITKVKKATNNSGTHTSSSGRTHGGGGGSF